MAPGRLAPPRMNHLSPVCVLPERWQHGVPRDTKGRPGTAGWPDGGKGPDQVGQGFSVNARRLAEGSQDITGLLGRCEAIRRAPHVHAQQC